MRRTPIHSQTDRISRRPRTALQIVTVVLCHATLTAVYAQQPVSSDNGYRAGFRDRVVLGSGFQLDRQLHSLAQLRDAQRWQDATDLIQQLQVDTPDAVVEAEPHRYLNLQDWLHSEIATWPADGRRVYRNTVDPAVTLRYQDALRRRDLLGMRELADVSFGSSVCDEVYWQLGHWAWEDGDLVAAESYWERLLPRSAIVTDGAEVRLAQLPDSDFTPEQVMARLALCRIFLSSPQEAHEAVDAYGRLFPMASGDLMGTTGPLSISLADTLDHSRDWSDGRAVDQAGGLIRSHEQPIHIANWAWSREFEESLPLMTNETTLSQSLPGPATSEVLVNADQLLVVGPHRIQVLDAATGEPAWPVGDSNRDGTVYAHRDVDASRPILPGEGQPQAAGVVADGRLYATVGWPIVVQAEAEVRELASRVVCLDLEESEGLIEWIAEHSEILPENWRFSGGPVIVGDQLFVPTTTESGPIALGLAAIAADDGAFRWHREICGIVDPRPPRTHGYGCDRLCASRGKLIWATRFGCVFQIEPQTGRVLWAVNYPSAQDEPGPSPFMTTDGAPPLVQRGVVYVVGVSQHRVLAIDETHGVVRWSARFSSRVTHLVGEHDGILAVGGDSLWGIDSSNGERLWNCSLGPPDGACVGAGIIAGDTIWWTTPDALLGTSTHTGELLARHEIREAWGLRGGTLALTAQHLLLLEPGRISAIELR